LLRRVRSRRSASRWLLSAVLSALTVIALILAWYDHLYTVPTGREVAGSVVSLYKNQRIRAFSPTVFMVKLDNGPIVVVGGTAGLPYRLNARVLVQERRSVVFGLRHYEFERFIEPP